MSSISTGMKIPRVNRLIAMYKPSKITDRGTTKFYNIEFTRSFWNTHPMEGDTKLSLVIPTYNEEENLPVLLKEISDITPQLPGTTEIILVNDGSTDRTLQVMLDLKTKYDRVRVISLDKNYGLSAALHAGFRAAGGEIIVSLDADLQNDPADIPKLLHKIPEYDVVIGIRKRRNDPFLKRISSRIANGIRDFFLNEKWQDTGCTLKAYKRSYLQNIKLFTGLHRFLPTLLMMEHARILEMEVNHRKRIYGKSKYYLWNRLTGPLRDLFAVRWMKQRHFSYRSEEK
jgi:glycosyltransferase involved in cell wall biosynthesis